MVEEKKRKRSKKEHIDVAKYIRIGICIIGVILCVSKGWEYWENYRERERAVEQQRVLEAEQQRLIEEKARLQTKEEVEKVARDELGLVKKDEVPYVR